MDSTRSLTCRACGTALPAWARYCRNCGQQQSAELSAPSGVAAGAEHVLSWQCATCASFLPAGARYCWDCGRPVAPAKEQETDQIRKVAVLALEVPGLWLVDETPGKMRVPGVPAGPQTGAPTVPSAPAGPQTATPNVPGAPAGLQTATPSVPGAPAGPQSGAMSQPLPVSGKKGKVKTPGKQRLAPHGSNVGLGGSGGSPVPRLIGSGATIPGGTLPGVPTPPQTRVAPPSSGTSHLRILTVPRLQLILLLTMLTSGIIALVLAGPHLPFIGKGGGSANNTAATLGLTPTSTPIIASAATVTITPTSQLLSNTFTIDAVTGTPTTQQVQARQLSAKTQTYAKTVNATGQGTRPATSATGTLGVQNFTQSPITG